MNWYERAKIEASSTNYSNLLNSSFDNGWGDVDPDEAEEEVAHPDKPAKPKKKANQTSQVKTASSVGSCSTCRRIR